MKKGSDEDYREYAVRWKNAASMVRPSLINREENSLFVDTLASPYYDILIVNTFMEFEELMYSVGRIEDGIRRGKIADTGASMMEIAPDRVTLQCMKKRPDENYKEYAVRWKNVASMV